MLQTNDLHSNERKIIIQHRLICDAWWVIVVNIVIVVVWHNGSNLSDESRKSQWNVDEWHRIDWRRG